jgi:hypothetical protein
MVRVKMRSAYWLRQTHPAATRLSPILALTANHHNIWPRSRTNNYSNSTGAMDNESLSPNVGSILQCPLQYFLDFLLPDLPRDATSAESALSKIKKNSELILPGLLDMDLWSLESLLSARKGFLKHFVPFLTISTKRTTMNSLET